MISEPEKKEYNSLQIR